MKQTKQKTTKNKHGSSMSALRNDVATLFSLKPITFNTQSI